MSEAQVGMLTEDELMRLAEWNLERAAFYDEAAVAADAPTRLLAEAVSSWCRERAQYFHEVAVRDLRAHAPLRHAEGARASG